MSDQCGHTELNPVHMPGRGPYWYCRGCGEEFIPANKAKESLSERDSYKVALEAQAGEIERLRREFDKLTGEQFSDRVHVALRAKLKAAERDANRYRWLRSTQNNDVSVLGGDSWELYDEDLDRIADAALAPDVTEIVIDSPQEKI